MKFLKESQQVKLRRPLPNDSQEFTALMRQSQELHYPWVSPPKTEEAFEKYLQTRQKPQNDGFLVCHAATEHIMGVINLNEIVRGCFHSAYLGYYIGSPYAGQGYMQEALALVIVYAFQELELHRLEANIQPANATSIALVKRCGFQREGFSPRYLKIDGDWRDHERWAILVD
ncbi:hypothetical protein CSA56_03505 [candidate division KSB3 bacterium]|uniref:N-acetyltransferase domain-containing protein n=1 Tax=candidate division KSB3 bacterium TaxID=2044937 RepID=A0A2G6KJ10_9BACT|nr:MAG: hypothetical protein CSA56_03505 [candidate division KSB3 bacterium]